MVNIYVGICCDQDGMAMFVDHVQGLYGIPRTNDRIYVVVDFRFKRGSTTVRSMLQYLQTFVTCSLILQSDGDVRSNPHVKGSVSCSS